MTDADPVAQARQYPAAVTVVRRAMRGPAAAEGTTTIGDIEAWLLGPAIIENDLAEVVESLAWRLVAAGIALDRLTVHVGTLHPQLVGFMWAWYRADGICDEARIARPTLNSDSYRKNPLARVIEAGETLRLDPRRADSVEKFPLMADLRLLGITDYIALPFRTGGLVHTTEPLGGPVFLSTTGEPAVEATRQHNAATIATSAPEGFSAQELAAVDRVLRIFALHLERHIAMRIASNLVDTYIGPVAGGEVLHGTIKRGDGAAINAIIWVSDLRDFTGLADRLSARDVTSVLNGVFERFVGAVADHCGDVLKFIGDGLLAVFRFDDERGRQIAAEAAMYAARQALADLDALNTSPPEALRAIPGWQPLRAGIALHEGEVFFGNVGAPDRLDFTVIGRAVNEASRVEALTKTLGRRLLITEGVARHLQAPLVDLGNHVLRGAGRPVRIFAVDETDERDGFSSI